MANSIYKDLQGPDWPLGYVNVPTPRTPVNIMVNIDPGNNNAPGAVNGPGSNASEYTPTVYGLWFAGYKPGNNSVAMQYNTGNVYVMRAAAGGSGNATDTGALVGVIPPGSTTPLVITPATPRGFSPYRYFVDADNANDGALVLAIGG